MSNVEGMYSVYFIKKTEQSETTLRHSAVRYSIFCGSLFPWFYGSLFPGSAVRWSLFRPGPAISAAQGLTTETNNSQKQV
jgi:hypothetical protein